MDIAGSQLAGSAPRLQIVYPDPASNLIVPTDFGGARGRIVMEATHRDPGARLFWHLDGRLIATANAFHELGVSLDPGQVTLTLACQDGDRRSRHFQMLDTAQGGVR